MKSYFTVTAVVRHKGKVLILKKSSDDWTYPDKWSFCSGYAKEFQSAEDNILREIKEETGLIGKIIKKGKLIQIEDKKKQKNWIVMAFLCTVNSAKVRLDKENADFKWVFPHEVKNYPTVPGLEKDLKVLGLE